jgi:hypothetical protein
MFSFTPLHSISINTTLSRELLNYCDISAFLLLQDMVAAAGQVRGVANPPAVVSVANLTSAQVQVAAQRLASANLVSQSPTVVTTVVTKGKYVLNPSLWMGTEIFLLLREKEVTWEESYSS